MLSTHRWLTWLNPRQNLQTRLGLSTAATTIALSTLLSLLVGQISRIQLERQIEQSQAELARQVADQLDQGMFERYRDIQSLAILEPLRQPADPIAKKRFFLESEQKTYPYYAWIGITDRQGTVIASTQKLLEGKNVSQRPWYQNSLSALHVGDVHEAKLLAQLLPSPTGEPLRFVDIAAPLHDEQGNFLGVLGAHLSWSWARDVEQSVSASLANHQVEFFIVSQDGTVLLGSKSSQGKKLVLSSLQQSQSQQTGFAIERWIEQDATGQETTEPKNTEPKNTEPKNTEPKTYVIGFARTQGYRAYPGLGWTVLVRQPTDLALAPARSLQTQVFLYGTGLGLLFALWNWFRSRRIVQPLLQLTAAAQRISEQLGETSQEQNNQGSYKPSSELVKAPIVRKASDRGLNEVPNHLLIPHLDRQDELATLSQAFQHMVQRLSDRQAELQQVNQQLRLDMVQRIAVEQKVREQAALLNIATDAIFVRSLDGMILFWNQGAERIYGWQADEAVGQNAQELLNSQNSTQLEIAWQQVCLAGEWRGELPKVTRCGRSLTVDSHWTLARDDDGTARFILTVDTDITEKKQLEAQFFRTQRLESLGTLAGGIAHDMNNILTPILTSSQLLQLRLSDTDPKNQRLLQILVDSARRGADLVKQILSFAKGYEGDRATVQVRHVLKEIHKIIQSTFPKSIEVEFDVPTQDLWTIAADATQLHQVFMNLCVNARDAMIDRGQLTDPLTGLLTIKAENFSIDPHIVKMHPEAQARDYVAISVMDTGAGMSPSVLDHIFEPFYTTKEINKGTGLGLSTVATIVKSHGGFINVYSEVGQGTRFVVYLPADLQPLPVTSTVMALPPGNGEGILIVDDETLIVEIAKTALEAYHYQVTIANNGMEALVHYQTHADRIQVVLIDMMMPVLNGAQAIEAFRQINPNLKIIATSGLVREETTMPVVDGFLVKPYTLKQLLQTLQAVLHPVPQEDYSRR